jgi:carbon-monoxide dehydrogenase medium subunit
MTRQRDLLDSLVVQERLPLLAEALTHVGHRATRNRGTVGGSLCHLDPAAELVAVAAALDATIEIAGPQGDRSVAIAAFPLGYMTPSLAPEEMVVAIRLPLPPVRHGHCFTEFSRRHGDFAIVSAAVILTAQDGLIDQVSVTLGGVGSVPLRMPEAEATLRGGCPGPALFAEAAAFCDGIDAMEDALIPGWYRRRLAAVLVRRGLATAWSRL